MPRRSVEDIEQEIKVMEYELAELSERLYNASSDWRPEHYAEIDNRQQQNFI